jgi:UDP-N-acetylglucosamine 2-epimerase
VKVHLYVMHTEAGDRYYRVFKPGPSRHDRIVREIREYEGCPESLAWYLETTGGVFKELEVEE